MLPNSVRSALEDLLFWVADAERTEPGAAARIPAILHAFGGVERNVPFFKKVWDVSAFTERTFAFEADGAWSVVDSYCLLDSVENLIDYDAVYAELEEMWKEGFVTYHGTSRENAAFILEEGIKPSTPHTGLKLNTRGVYTSLRAEEAERYGDIVLRITVPPHKTPPMLLMQEEDWIIGSAVSSVCAALDIQTNYLCPGDGIYDDTLVFSRTIPPEWISVEGELC